MKRKLLSGLAALTMLFALAAMPAGAEGETPATTQPTKVAKIEKDDTTTEYDTLQAAVEAAKDGDTITLLKDVTLDATNVPDKNGAVQISKSITIDGADKLVSVDTGFRKDTDGMGLIHVFNIMNNANVTIQNITINGSGADGNVARHGINLFPANGGTGKVTLENVTVNDCSGYAVVNNGYDLVVNGLTTRNNGWGGINLDNKGGDCSLSVQNASIGETNKIYVEPTASDKKAVVKNSGGIEVGSNAEAKIGGSYYKTLADAVSALKSDDTLDLLKDVEAGAGVYISGVDTFTLNGNGHTITAAEEFKQNTDGQYHLMKIRGSTNATVTDLVLLGTNKSKHALDLWGNGSVVLNNVTLNHKNAEGGAPLIVNGSHVTVTGKFEVVTGANSWYGVNVDNKNGEASLTFAADSNLTFTNNSGGPRAFVYAENTSGTSTDLPPVKDEDGRLGSDKTETAEVFHIHNIASDWASDDTGHYHLCAEGGEQHDYAAHTSDDGVVTTEPTADKAGVLTYSCTVCGRELRTEPITEVLEILPTITETNYTTGTDDGAVLHCSGKLKDFRSVTVDGALVDPSNYTLADGSTILTFKKAYLDTLSVGRHDVVLTYKGNRTVPATLTVVAAPAPTAPAPTTPKTDHPEIAQAIKDGTWGKPDPTPAPAAKPAAQTVRVPQTGDAANPVLWAVVMTAALLGLAGVGIARRRGSKG